MRCSLCALLLPLCAASALAADSAPWVTDADLDMYFSDTRARVVTDAGPVAFYAPGIAAVRADGKLLRVLRRTRDLLVVQMEKGTHEVEVATGEDSQPSPVDRASSFEPIRRSHVTTADELNARQAALKPGEELVIANGIYLDWEVTISASGTSESPITIRPQTPGGVVFMNNTRIRITGSFIVLREFRFSHCGTRALQVDGGDDNRITQCQFFQCGSSTSTFAHALNINWNSDRNRVDHCYFTGSKSMSLGQSAGSYPEPGSERQVGVQNRFDHNIFRDIERIWLNGQEAIQMGQGQAPLLQPRGLIEYNLFDNASGDFEIVSLKSSNNTVRHNLFVNSRGSFYFRNGNENRLEGNILIGNTSGFSVRGSRHTIINNLIVDMAQYGITLQTGTVGDDSYGAVKDCLIAHNTIVNCAAAGFQTATPPGNETSEFPEGNALVNNIFVGDRGTLVQLGDPSHARFQSNLFHAADAAELGHTGESPVIGDPLLVGSGLTVRPGKGSPALGAARPLPRVPTDAWGTSRPDGDGRDLGSVELPRDGSFQPSIRLPDLPERKKLAIAAYAADVVGDYDQESPLRGWRPAGGVSAGEGVVTVRDGSLTHTTDLPADFVLEWEYQPESFDSRGSVVFVSASEDSGYWLGFGGADAKGVPSGVITLAKGRRDQVILQVPDTTYYRMNFIATWPGNTVKMPFDTPIEELWYRCRLLKTGASMRMEMTNISLTEAGSPVGPSTVKSNLTRPGMTPVLIWEDRDGLYGPALEGRGLRIEQSGAGRWRNMRIREARYIADLQPGAPANLSARAIGPNRVTLTWQPSPPVPGSVSYEVHRGVRAGFETSERSRIAGDLGVGAYDDLGLPRATRYVYRVRAISQFGVASDWAETTTTTADRGPAYITVDADDYETLDAPMALGTDAATNTTFVWAPGQPFAHDAPPPEGRVEYAFSVERSGDYTIWGLVLTPDAGKDSFYWALDAPPGGRFSNWGTGVHNRWEWSRIAGDAVRLDAGRHTLRFTYREPQARLARILVTNDPDFSP